ncbi:MAG: YqzG/YhdC family protein [Alicyclobacillus sp.]|nr:YqzG/YhdC family protein [Alicyclobacillus sp.]
MGWAWLITLGVGQAAGLLIPVAESPIEQTLSTVPWPRTQVQAPYVKPVPAYAKWGRVAVAAAKKRYPGASVIDYQHLGGETRPGGTAVERFKLWMRQGSKEWGLWVDVVFQPRTQQVVAIHMRTRET